MGLEMEMAAQATMRNVQRNSYGMNRQTTIDVQNWQKDVEEKELRRLGKTAVKAAVIAVVASLPQAHQALAAGAQTPHPDGGVIGAINDVAAVVEAGFQSAIDNSLNNPYVIPGTALVYGMADTIFDTPVEGESTTAGAFATKVAVRSAVEGAEILMAVAAAKGVTVIEPAHPTIALIGKAIWPFASYQALLPDVLVKPINNTLVGWGLKAINKVGHKAVDGTTTVLEQVSKRNAKT